MNSNKKSNMVMVLKVLEEHSDANHFLNYSDIIDIIYQETGLEYERKAIASSIRILIDDFNYNIVKAGKKGVALIERTFEDAEIRYLVDAIYSCKSITSQEATRLIEKITSCLSLEERRKYCYDVRTSSVFRTNNKSTFYNIDAINEALKRRKGISFRYYTYDNHGNLVERDNGHTYLVSPCYLVNSNGRYYLLAYNEKYKSVLTFRVDLMTKTRVDEKTHMVDPRSIDEFKQYHSFNEYISSHIYLFGGQLVHAKVKLKDAHAIQYIKDWFGESATFNFDNNQIVADVQCDETAFIYWAMQYGEHITVLSPNSVVEKIKKNAQNILDKYK